MATSDEATVDLVKSALANENWRDEYAENWLNNRLAQEAYMLDKWQRQEARALKVADFAMTGKYEPPTDEDMAVSIGNKEIHIHQAPQTAVQTNTPAVESAGGLLKRAIPLALAAVLGGGAVSGIGWWLLGDKSAAAVDKAARIRVFWGEGKDAVELKPGDKLGAEATK